MKNNTSNAILFPLLLLSAVANAKVIKCSSKDATYEFKVSGSKFLSLIKIEKNKKIDLGSCSGTYFSQEVVSSGECSKTVTNSQGEEYDEIVKFTLYPKGSSHESNLRPGYAEYGGRFIADQVQVQTRRWGHRQDVMIPIKCDD